MDYPDGQPMDYPGYQSETYWREVNALRLVGTNLKVRGCEKKLALTKYFLKPKGEFSIFDGKVVVFFFKFLPKKWERGEGSRAYSAPPTPTGLLSLTAPPSELWDQGLHDRNPKNWYLLWTMHGDSPGEFQ